MTVRTAVIPAAGRGTRWLPFTKSVPKELLPIGPVPVLQLVVDECIGAGIDHVVVVTSRSKPALEAYFEPDQQVIDDLRARGEHRYADALARLTTDVRVSFAYQDEPRGLGHAVGCARELVGSEPCAVVLPDEVFADSRLLARMAALCSATGGSVIGLTEVPPADVTRYGIVSPSGIEVDGLVPLASMVEKPTVETAPSTLAIIGRYVLTPDIFEHIDRAVPGRLGEIQLTDALRAQAESGPFHGVLNTTPRYDTGTPAGWFEAVVAWADGIG